MTSPQQITSHAEPPVVRSGRVRIKGQGSLSGWTWKAKSLVLTDEALVIPGNKIPLEHITKVERVDLKPYCLLLEVKNRTYHLSFENDGELYDWQDDVYARCPKIGVGNPFGFEHNVHVSPDAISNTFTGLPSQWNDLINPNARRAAAAPGLELEKIDFDAGGRRSSTLYEAPSLAYNSHATSGGAQRKDHFRRSPSPAILDGNLAIKVAGLFSGWRWKHRWLVLRSKTLTIYESPHSTSGIVISLDDIDKIDIVKPMRLRITTKSSRKRYLVSFNLDTQAYAWRNAMSPRITAPNGAEISYPWNFVHNSHVGVDPKTGKFTGLPNEWKQLVEHHSFSPQQQQRQHQHQHQPAQ